MSTIGANNGLRLNQLRRQWLGVSLVWLLTWLVGWVLLRQVWSLYANRWAALSGLALLYGLHVVWRNLDANHREGELAILPRLGWGNWLSIGRGLAIAGVAGFLFSPWPMGALGWLPVLLYTAADIADYFDGYIARKTNHATRLGAVLDMEFDGLGMAIVSVLGVLYGQLPWWYLLLGSARYLFVLGMWWRRRRGLPLHDLHPSVHRRLFAGFQMGFMSAVLWPIIPSEMTTIAGTLFAIPTALGFLRDWLVVSGRIDVRNGRYQAMRRFLVALFRRWLPPVLRAALFVAMALIFATLDSWLIPAPWRDLLHSWGVPFATTLAALLGATALFGTPLLTIGAMCRILSLTVAFPIGFDIASRGLSWANATALSCAICLMLLGSGPLSLWQPEERFVLEKLGD